MTEAEWIACTDPGKMLEFLRGKASDRKLRLFSVGCIRRGWHLIDDPDLRRGVEALERFVDGCAKEMDRIAARKTGNRVANRDTNRVGREIGGAAHSQGRLGCELWWAARKTINLKVVLELGTYASVAFGFAAVKHRWDGRKFGRAEGKEREQQQAILLDIFGNPFRPITINRRSWLTPTVTAVVGAIYEERAFNRLPILADALEDAGCRNADILAHYRQPGVHVRGCWLGDLLLGRVNGGFYGRAFTVYSGV